MKFIKLSFLVAALLATGTFCHAQLYINGATFVIQSGATVTAQGDVQNSGTITNDGILQVQGNFLNTSVYNGTVTTGVLQMTGTGNVTFNSGASTINNLVINKTNATDRVLLTGTTLLGFTYTHTNGVFSTDPITNPSYSLTAPVSATFSFAAGKEIVGKVKRTSWINGSSSVFNQTNMLVTTNAGTNPTDVSVTMIPLSEGGDPTQAEREVKRKFLFAATGGSGYTADIRYPYLTAELNTNTEGNLVPWQLVTAEWNGRLTPVTRDGVNDYVSTTGILATDFNNQEWKLADPKYTFNVTAYIKGAWLNASGLMRTTLVANNKLPLTQPYTAAPYNYSGTESVVSIPNLNIVDWILIEHRKPLSGLPADALTGTISGRRAAFLLNNGTIVDLDGVTPLGIDITKQGNAFVVVRHRNHLAIMSNALASATGSFTNNFSVLANSYKKPLVSSDPTVLLAGTAPGNTLYGMWPGDVNTNGSITSGDVSIINTAIAGPLSGNTDVYNVRDINLDKNVTSGDVSITNTSVAAFAATSTFKPSSIEKELTTHVPGEHKGK